MRPTHIVVLAILLLALPCTATAGRNSSSAGMPVPFTTIASGASTKHPKRNRVFLARSKAAAKAWNRWLGASARKAVGRVDFDRNGVVAVFRIQRTTGAAITRVVKSSHTLGLWLTTPKQPPPNSTLLTVGAHHLVSIDKRFLRDVTRLVVHSVTVK